MAYTGINFNRARMPARQGIIDPSRMGPPQIGVDGGSMRQGIVSAPTMREALMQTQPQQNVAEILSQGLPEMMPDLGGATSAASRQRQIADMLLQGAQSQDNTSIAGGLSQLGQAFLARKAGQKADTAEDKQREMASLLMQQAMQGGEQGQASLQQLLTQNPEAAMQYAMQVNAPAPPPEYGLDLVPVTDPATGQTSFVQASKSGGVRPVEGYVPPPPAPDQRPWWAQEGGGVDPAQLANAAAGRSAGVTVMTGDMGAGQRPIVGNPAEGYQRVWDEASQSYRDEPIPGGDSARTREEDAFREYMKMQTAEFNYDNVTNEIDRAIELTDYTTAGVGGAVLRELPMTSARTLNNAITMVKANLGFDRLQQMREESKTGGALGAVTEKEIDLLQSTVQRLDQLTDPAELQRALKVVKDQYIKVQSLRQQMYAMKYSATEPGQSRPTPGASTPVTTNDLPPGFEMIP